MLEREQFARTIVGLAEAFGRELSSPAIGVYYAALRDLDDASWKRAIERCATECTRMPAPAELRQLAGEHTAAERAVSAWTEATRAAARVGAYRSVDFEDKAINAAVRSMGGWTRFCGLAVEELERFGRRDFVAAYNAYAKSCPETLAAHLPGIEEQRNTQLERGVEPVRIPATTPLVGGGTKVLPSGAPTLLVALPGGGGRS